MHQNVTFWDENSKMLWGGGTAASQIPPVWGCSPSPHPSYPFDPCAFGARAPPLSNCFRHPCNGISITMAGRVSSSALAGQFSDHREIGRLTTAERERERERLRSWRSTWKTAQEFTEPCECSIRQLLETSARGAEVMIREDSCCNGAAFAETNRRQSDGLTWTRDADAGRSLFCFSGHCAGIWVMAYRNAIQQPAFARAALALRTDGLYSWIYSTSAFNAPRCLPARPWTACPICLLWAPVQSRSK